MRDEYDFSHGERGAHADEFEGTMEYAVFLDEDVAKVFKDADEVNKALRLLIQIAGESVSKPAEP